jgi:Family of unknown function (DUF5372)
MILPPFSRRRLRRAIPHRGRACLGVHRQRAYKLSSLPDEVTITRVGHPLRGQRLRVDRGAGERRKDRCLVVVLPDGSPTLLPVAWTDVEDGASSATVAPPSTRLSVSGLRQLIRLVDAMVTEAPANRSP